MNTAKAKSPPALMLRPALALALLLVARSAAASIPSGAPERAISAHEIDESTFVAQLAAAQDRAPELEHASAFVQHAALSPSVARASGVKKPHLGVGLFSVALHQERRLAKWRAQQGMRGSEAEEGIGNTTFHLYYYAFSNPLRYTDPDGHNPIADFFLAQKAITGANEKVDAAKQVVTDHAEAAAKGAAVVIHEAGTVPVDAYINSFNLLSEWTTPASQMQVRGPTEWSNLSYTFQSVEARLSNESAGNIAFGMATHDNPAAAPINIAIDAYAGNTERAVEQTTAFATGMLLGKALGPRGSAAEEPVTLRPGVLDQTGKMTEVRPAVDGSAPAPAPSTLGKAARTLSDAELRDAVRHIHAAEFGNAPRGKAIPITVTATESGRVVVSQVGKVPGPRARAQAEALLGSGVEFVRGTSRSNAPGIRGGDAEARGIQYLGEEARGARQATTHYACPSCEARQAAAGVINVSGAASEHGGRITIPNPPLYQ